MNRSRLLLAGLGLVGLTACGTTAPLTSTAQVPGGSGLEAPGSTGIDGGLGDTTPDGTGTASGVPGSSVPAGSDGTGATATTGTTTSNGGSSGSGGSGGSAPSAPGISVKTPLKIGIQTTDTGRAIAALGGSTSSSKKPEDAYRAIIKGLNASGGLGGRRLDATYQTIDATSTNYQADGDRTCAAFKDAKDEVVLSQSAATDYGAAACFQKAGISMLSTVASDTVGHNSAPLLFNAFAPRLDRSYGAVVDQLTASGYLTKASKIGVVRITCAEADRAYKNTVLPRMKGHGLATPLEVTVSCASGFNDAGAYSAAMQSAVLQFKSRGVDRVFVIGPQEALLLTYFAIQAENQDYHPGYALSSATLPVVTPNSSTYPRGQLGGLRGVGWSPLSDTGVDARLPAERRCVELAKKGGFAPAGLTETFTAYQACTNLFLLEAGLARSAGRADGQSLRGGILSLGSSLASPGLLGDATLFGQGRPDGAQSAAEWAYVAKCNCIKYLAAPKVIS